MIKQPMGLDSSHYLIVIPMANPHYTTHSIGHVFVLLM